MSELIEKKDFSVFGNMTDFENSQRMAKALSESKLIPKEFQGKISDCIIALEIANRVKASPLFVMQNLYIVHGKPSWSSQFIISAINSCGKFSPLRFKFNDNKTSCYAYAIEKETGEELQGTEITTEMAKTEGWYTKPGSKWKTMPEQMLRYRAASFFGRIYAPEILMGMRGVEEVEDETIKYDIEIEKTEPKKFGLAQKKEKKPDFNEIMNKESIVTDIEKEI